MRREAEEELRGAGVAAVLAGSWRAEPPPFHPEPEALATVIPLLMQGTAAPLAWRRLRTTSIDSFRPARPLRQAYRTHALESAGHELHLQEVLPLLRAAGVEPILVKGWSVARLYPETGLRPYCDLDLCVGPDQLAIAMTVLSNFDSRRLSVELHRGIPDLKDRTWREAYRRSRLARLGDVDVRVLCPEDSFRLLCLHLMRHGSCAPLPLCDLAVCLESQAADFDWDYCLSGNRARAAWIRCWAALACRLLGARPTDPALAARLGNPPAWLGPAVLARWARPLRESNWLDPVKAAYRRRLPPLSSRPLTQFLGMVGRVAEIPSRLLRQGRRWRRPSGRPFDVHDEAGD
jgi:hypothetical protein